MQRVALDQGIDHRIGIVEDVTPRAGGIDREGAIGRGNAGRRHELRRTVDIGNIEVTGHRRDFVLHDCAGGRAGDDGRVIGTGDRDVDHLCRPVCGRDRHEFVQAIAIGQGIDRCICLIQHIGPRAGGIDRESPIETGDAALHHESCGSIGVAGIEVAACRRFARLGSRADR